MNNCLLFQLKSKLREADALLCSLAPPCAPSMALHLGNSCLINQTPPHNIQPTNLEFIYD